MEKPTGTVQAVDRALDLMELLAVHPDGARLTDLARQAGLAPSTAHRLLTTLERRGFAQFDATNSHWVVGQKAFSVGIAFTRWQSFIAAAHPFLRRLRDDSHETANLGILEEGEVVTVAQVESREITRAIASPGGRAPVLCSGMGKAIIATWPDEAIDAFMDRHGFWARTRHSLRTTEAVRTEIATIRERGFAYDNEEFTYGVRCVAAVVWDPYAEPIGAISISALANRLPQAGMAAMGAKVLAAAKELTSVLGGVMPAQKDAPRDDVTGL
ncbi:IclR family transcriptional regulator [Paracoccus sp. (in: a-proteobacteria)]|uniref:IclR family transcriptional regulator n=1 Tax=Paracoccus sp. TaxID=267 RepID=UPI0026DFFDA5|nr:IclR family transcriptional regulator [Paracoccus sp. (in: a-proteobacteria)]MDO5646321.1 IclR family transcriptional regulator [Paracoccus sp. (in: a-proteobacteria)]